MLLLSACYGSFENKTSAFGLGQSRAISRVAFLQLPVLISEECHFFLPLFYTTSICGPHNNVFDSPGTSSIQWDKPDSFFVSTSFRKWRINSSFFSLIWVAMNPNIDLLSSKRVFISI